MPDDGDMYLAYMDFEDANEAALRARFPHKQIVTITRAGGDAVADGCDIETRLLTVAQGAAWAMNRIRAGKTPFLYCNASTYPSLRSHCEAVGILGHVTFYVAHYDGDPTIPDYAMAKQYLAHPGASPGDYDVSSVRPYWRGVDPKPKPRPVDMPKWYHRQLHETKPYMHGEDVKAVQRKVRADVDGKYGPNTVAKVRGFQKVHHLTVDGIVGPSTARLMR